MTIDIDVILVWGELTGRLEVEGKRMPAMDSLIAAIAIHNNCSLVTRNEDDFKNIDLTIINP
ncbi:PIN domain-containing protein [Calothrix sp. CCY 0018]|uniref:PIN domain-containing protein n=1 Tax=Calothrix sp. CCY 0018 TaxID=3103864 RepID=UPI0039C67568